MDGLWLRKGEMRRRGSGRIVAASAVVVVLAALAVAAWVWRRRAGSATPDWGPITSLLPSSLANLPSSLQPAPPPSADAGAKDAGVIVHRQAAPLSSAQLGAPLVHGKFVSACGAPDDMKVVVHLDVKKGRASKIAVKTEPASSAVASCIERAIRDLQWDVSPQVGHVTVTY